MVYVYVGNIGTMSWRSMKVTSCATAICAIKSYVTVLICYIFKYYYYPFFTILLILENVNVPQARDAGPMLV